MTESPENEEETPTEGDAPAEDAAPEEAPAADPAPAEEVPAEEASEPAAEESSDDEPTAEDADDEPTAEKAPEAPDPEVALAEDAAAENDEAAAEETPAPVAEEPKTDDGKKKDVVPGADLEPIAISEERELSAEERAAREADEEERAAREAQAEGDVDDEAIAPRTVSVPADTQIQATGKRKSAVARVIVRAGNGGFHVNDKPLEEYFPSTQHQSMSRQPLVASGYDGNVDVRVRVHGGGISGQAGAVRHGVARALTNLEPELRGELKRRGLLTRDDRRKERKKAGLKKARKRPQFSKR